MNDTDLDRLISSLTPGERADGVTTYRNTVAISCPACNQPFDDLVVCEEEFNSLELTLMLDICVTTHDGDALLFTHKQDA